jgi:hypothetical protein
VTWGSPHLKAVVCMLRPRFAVLAGAAVLASVAPWAVASTATATPLPIVMSSIDCAHLEDGDYPNPQDKTSFYTCSNGNAYLQHCASYGDGNKLVFDVPTKRCEWPHLAQNP